MAAGNIMHSVAAVQAAPVFLDRQKTVEKACDLILQAAGKGAKMAVFPEAFIPGYPDWVWGVPNNQSALLNELYGLLVENAVEIPDSATEKLCKAARSAKIHVIIGVNERNVEGSNASLYNTLMYIDNKGGIMGKHRKLIPTSAERLVWARGDGSTMPVFDTPVGRVGGLICWENYMPLARQAMYDRGIQILAAPTWDKSDNWQLSMRHIAREGGVFVVNCCMSLAMKDIPETLEFRQFYPDDREWINSGNSCVIDPAGKIIAGPVEGGEEILLADIELGKIARSKRMFDVAGHYARPDVFNFKVKG